MIDRDARDELAPGGTLRGGVVVAPAKSVSFAVRDEKGVHGVPVDLLRACAESLGVPLMLTEFANSGQLTDAFADGRCDMGFMPRDAAREARVAFGPSIYAMASTYLVPAGSAIHAIDEVNRAGLRIVAIANTTTARAARRTAPLATVEEVAGVDLMTAMAQRGDGDAFALSHDSFLGLLPQLPGARILPGQFQETGVAVAVPKGRPRALALVTRWVDEAKTSGVLRRSFDDAGFSALPLAPREG